MPLSSMVILTMISSRQGLKYITRQILRKMTEIPQKSKISFKSTKQNRINQYLHPIPWLPKCRKDQINPKIITKIAPAMKMIILSINL